MAKSEYVPANSMLDIMINTFTEDGRVPFPDAVLGVSSYPQSEGPLPSPEVLAGEPDIRQALGASASYGGLYSTQ